ncbi:formate dehydrogenase accessory sulfurtransferase FdhD [Paenactinomyces guangxiensis]|uniref:Sulfur carrier protein FdhD n=1 Tax=Paenactinomyces guangxiensis TaxID=1490290 RepID=A0A7W1WQ05_9BACL|nr:formate dehydrogenase accessory sulfurtransferase FdhD [Paenactinomyces guangxiensis]MBA4493798.1 formate dehydrogenase accessory sulfurtransferase FdhD [Paenactinomyces guangxiensis]MBH8591264.1 formate dehydrogenase accessory sulfurtransferase FdhD [Paenactinomyces guangxiensis]
MEVTANRKILKYDGTSLNKQEDEIVSEYPLTIVVNGEEFATLVCTPTDLEDMAIGFLAAEGVLRLPDEIKSVTIDEKRGFAYVELKNQQPVGKEFYSKRFIGSCCGKSRQSFYFYNDVTTAKTVVSKTHISVEQCFHLMRLLQQSSSYFQATGGVHNAALCDKNSILISRTDIGRHNTLDKIYGHWMRNRIPLHDKLIVFSGRISSEVLLKTAKIGVGIILSKSAPTDLALKMADELGITVVGFIRGNTCNVYTHPERITEPFA